MRNIWRLSVVFVIGVAAFLVAINRLDSPPFGSCQQGAHTDPTYSVTVDPDPSVLVTQYHLTVTHRGEPIDRNRICVRADMGGEGGMSGMGVVAQAIPAGPGSYNVPVRFGRRGPWQGAVLIQHAGGNVEVPIHFDVRV